MITPSNAPKRGSSGLPSGLHTADRSARTISDAKKLAVQGKLYETEQSSHGTVFSAWPKYKFSALHSGRLASESNAMQDLDSVRLPSQIIAVDSREDEQGLLTTPATNYGTVVSSSEQTNELESDNRNRPQRSGGQPIRIGSMILGALKVAEICKKPPVFYKGNGESGLDLLPNDMRWSLMYQDHREIVEEYLTMARKEPCKSEPSEEALSLWYVLEIMSQVQFSPNETVAQTATTVCDRKGSWWAMCLLASLPIVETETLVKIVDHYRVSLDDKSLVPMYAVNCMLRYIPDMEKEELQSYQYARENWQPDSAEVGSPVSLPNGYKVSFSKPKAELLLNQESSTAKKLLSKGSLADQWEELDVYASRFYHTMANKSKTNPLDMTEMKTVDVVESWTSKEWDRLDCLGDSADLFRPNNELLPAKQMLEHPSLPKGLSVRNGRFRYSMVHDKILWAFFLLSIFVVVGLAILVNPAWFAGVLGSVLASKVWEKYFSSLGPTTWKMCLQQIDRLATDRDLQRLIDYDALTLVAYCRRLNIFSGNNCLLDATKDEDVSLRGLGLKVDLLEQRVAGNLCYSSLDNQMQIFPVPVEDSSVSGCDGHALRATRSVVRSWKTFRNVG